MLGNGETLSEIRVGDRVKVRIGYQSQGRGKVKGIKEGGASMVGTKHHLYTIELDTGRIISDVADAWVEKDSE